MRIGFVIPYFYPALGYGGTPRIAYEMARALARRGHQVQVLTTDSGGHDPIPADVISRIQKNGLDGIQVRYYRNLANNLAYRHRLFFPLSFFVDVKQRLLENDIVHIHDLRSFLAVAAHSALCSLEKPYVISPHGGLQHLGKKPAKAVFDFLWGKAILRDAAALCAVSPAEEKDAKIFGVATHRIHRCPSAIDADHYSDLPRRGEFASNWRLEDRQIVLFLGRLNWVKGVDILIQAIDLLKDLSKVHLVIAGPDDGGERKLRSLVTGKGLNGKITFTGFLNDAQKTQALVDSDALVIPSRSEGFPLALLEGLACGTPVITSSGCELGDWMPKDAAWSTFRSGDAADLAQLLRLTLRPGRDHEAMLEARKLVLTDFSTDTLAVRAEVLYGSLLKSRAVPDSPVRGH